MADKDKQETVEQEAETVDVDDFEEEQSQGGSEDSADVLSQEEIKELAEQAIGKSKDKSMDDLSPEQIRREAIEEYERERQKKEAEKRKESQQNKQISELKQQIEAMRNTLNQSNGRQSRTPSSGNQNPLQRTDDGKVKIPKREFDDAFMGFIGRRK